MVFSTVPKGPLTQIIGFLERGSGGYIGFRVYGPWTLRVSVFQ